MSHLQSLENLLASKYHLQSSKTSSFLASKSLHELLEEDKSVEKDIDFTEPLNIPQLIMIICLLQKVVKGVQDKKEKLERKKITIKCKPLQKLSLFKEDLLGIERERVKFDTRLKIPFTIEMLISEWVDGLISKDDLQRKLVNWNQIQGFKASSPIIPIISNHLRDVQFESKLRAHKEAETKKMKAKKKKITATLIKLGDSLATVHFLIQTYSQKYNQSYAQLTSSHERLSDTPFHVVYDTRYPYQLNSILTWSELLNGLSECIKKGTLKS